MTDWTDDLARARALRETIEDDPTAVASLMEELLELAHDEEWAVQRAAIDALGVGLLNCPEAGVLKLDALVQTALDSTVPCPNRWQDGLVSVTAVAPETTCNTIIGGFETIPSDQRGDVGTACLARILECTAIDVPTYLVDSMARIRRISQTVPPEARVHLLGTHLALIDNHREVVRPILTDVLSEFVIGNDDTRRIAADILCALAIHPEDGTVVIKKLIRWLAAHPRQPREQRPTHDPGDSLIHPTLTDAPPAGTLGVTQVVARIAEETPEAVDPHAAHIAASLTAWDSTRSDQWARSHLTRALAAVARQHPRTISAFSEDILALLTDDSEFVRYWASQALLALFPYRPDAVSSTILTDLLTDPNPDVRNLSADLTTGCVARDVVDTDAVVGDLRAGLSGDSNLTEKQAIRLLESITYHDPDAVRPVLSMVEQSLTDSLTASNAAAVFKVMITEGDGAVGAVGDAVPTLVDCLFADSLTVRSAAAEALTTIGTTYPSLLDDQLSVLLTVIEQDTAGIDEIGDVLVTVGDRPVGKDRTVFEYICNHTDAESVRVRRTASRLLGTFIEADTGNTDAAVTALTDRLGDDNARVREEALNALAGYVAESPAPGLVRSLYQTDTDHWRLVSADLLARTTLLDASWVSAEFQRWLADRLEETEGEPKRLFVEAAGYICGKIDAEDELTGGLVARLEDDPITEAAFTAIQRVVTEGATTIPEDELVSAVEGVVLDEDQSVPSTCLDVLSHVADDLDTPQAVADRLLTRLTAGNGNMSYLAEALARLCIDDVTLPADDVVAALKQYATDEPITARDWTCQNFARILRKLDAGSALREVFVPMANHGSDQRTIAFKVLASVANVWPAGVRPAVQTLQAGVQTDNDCIQGPALSALVAVGQEYPEVLHPIAERLVSTLTASENIVMKRRRYEALALLAADHALSGDAFLSLRRGLLNSDAAVTEYALEATADRDEHRLVPLLRRLDEGVPDWGSPPDHFSTDTEEASDALFEDFLPPNDPTVTADDVLNQLGQ